MSLRLDHIIIAVTDLESAISAYEDLGFTVVRGGTHSGGLTHNALIGLEDGTYLELLAPTDPARVSPPHDRDEEGYLFIFNRGPGLAGYALVTEDLSATIDRLRKNSIATREPVAGSRQLPSGEELRWRIAFLEDRPLPFLIEDETPRALRVPLAAENTQHANGASGILEVISGTRHLETETDFMRLLLEKNALRGAAMPSTETARFTRDGITLTAATPTTDDSPLFDEIRERGPGLLQIHVRTRAPGAPGLLDTQVTHGARIALLNPDEEREQAAAR